VSPLEIAANALATLSILLAGRNNVHTWWSGIVGCSLFAVLFYETRLYADVVLQLFFVASSVIGWWRWVKGKDGTPLPITRATARELIWSVPIGIAATAAYGAMLHTYTNAYAPFIDSSVLVFRVIAQWLMMQRRVETWPFWLLVNTIAVPLCASRGLYLTSVLYGVYWINAVVSWRWWQARVVQSSKSRTPI